MQRTIALAVFLASAVAAAQPGQTPPAPEPAPPPAPPPYNPPYQQPGGVPAPYAYHPQVQLTAEDRELLEDGEISDGQHLGGGLAALMLGFGSGQAIQGRWSDTGWLFTLGDGAAVALMIYGATRTVRCVDDRNNTCDHLSDTGFGEMMAGVLAFGGIRLWETIDAFAVPPEHNRKVRRLRQQLGITPMGVYGQW